MRFSTIASAAALLVGAAAPAVAFDFNIYDPKCPLGHFKWQGECCKVGGQSGGNPPSGNACPPLWYYTGSKCLPSYIPPFSQPSCGNGWVWNTSSWTCKPPATPPPSNNQCKDGKFWWERRSCCLEHGGPPSPPLPPAGSGSCPSSWYWHSGQGCCVPQHPSPPEPSCPPGKTWNPYVQCCRPDAPQPPPPTPSHKPRSAAEKRQHNAIPQHKKRAKRVTPQLSFCAAGLESCPTKGVFSAESECIDVLSELKSCGGCTSIGQGQDCTKMSNVHVSTCASGVCQIMACKHGYKHDTTNSTCVPELL